MMMMMMMRATTVMNMQSHMVCGTVWCDVFRENCLIDLTASSMFEMPTGLQDQQPWQAPSKSQIGCHNQISKEFTIPDDPNRHENHPYCWWRKSCCSSHFIFWLSLGDLLDWQVSVFRHLNELTAVFFHQPYFFNPLKSHPKKSCAGMFPPFFICKLLFAVKLRCLERGYKTKDFIQQPWWTSSWMNPLIATSYERKTPVSGRWKGEFVPNMTWHFASFLGVTIPESWLLSCQVKLPIPESREAWTGGASYQWYGKKWKPCKFRTGGRKLEQYSKSRRFFLGGVMSFFS